jgi:hypothetical protein
MGSPKGRRKGVRVRVHRKNLEDKYTTLPNDLHRGHDVYAGLTPHARVLLAAGLSCRDGWGTTLEEIEEWLDDLGRDRHEAVRRQLRERGFLTMTPDRIPAGEPDGGQFEWVLSFYMDPLPEADRDYLRDKKARPRRDKTAGGTMPGSSGHGLSSGNAADSDPDPGSEETAGQTVPGSSGHRQPGHGEPGSRQPGSRQPGSRQPGPGEQPAYKEEKEHLEKEHDLEELDHSEKDQIPPPLSDQLTRAGVDAAQGEDPPDERTRILTAALDAVLARRQGWSRTEVVTAMRAELDAGRSVQAVADAILVVANDPASTSPARLRTAGPWWNLGEPTVTGPIKYRDNGASQCRTHRGEPLDGCGKCKAEAVAVVDDADAPVERLDRGAAMAAIRAATGKGSAKFAQQRRRPPVLAEFAGGTSPANGKTPADALLVEATS